MATFAQSANSSVAERALATIAHLFDRAAARVAHHRIYSASLTELRTLSDRELDDIGISRAHLKDVARASADREIQL